jgi:hypothetical protein
MALWAKLQPFFDPFETRVVQLVVLLGLPYLALSIFRLVLQGSGFDFSQIAPEWAAAIAGLFFFTVAYDGLRPAAMRNEE